MGWNLFLFLFLFCFVLFFALLFWGYSKWWQIKQCAPDLNRGLSSNFGGLRNANPVEFTEEYVMCTRKCILVMFTNGINMSLPRQTRVEIHWLSGKEKVPDTIFSKKKVTLRVFWDMKEVITIDFLPRSSPVNSENSLGKINLIYWMTLV